MFISEVITEVKLSTSSKSKLYIVATPIGNREDITLRALDILKNVDFIICEEMKTAGRFLHSYQLQKPVKILNEHNEREYAPQLVLEMLQDNLSAALISDGGTPLFADPGNYLVQECQLSNLPVVPVPGASSLMAALMAAGLEEEGFLYCGFLPASREERTKAIKNLPTFYNLVILETPYRMQPLLRDLIKVLGGGRKGVLAYRLTCPEEKIFWGNLHEIQLMTSNLPKGEFVLILKKK
ncbi:MAG: 16S rRNA (cytidine(1402)-2'-O)-methyltransferase [Candidatus Cloacimonetes bacterium]|nr:16S rRNA (cytidine(1402)-2'-O)-methyltransferase [Candidatus Cloacimonadota bacterium]